MSSTAETGVMIGITAVQDIAKSCDYTYGSRRMKREPNASGYLVSCWKARRLIQEAGIRVKHRKKYKVTMDSNHPLPVFENQLNQRFTVAKLDQVHVCDITCIWPQEGWLYLAVVIDFFLEKWLIGALVAVATAVFYNNQRLHSYLNYKNPNQYEAEAEKSIKAA